VKIYTKIMNMETKEIKRKLSMVINCLMAHPDNEPNSEFADRIDDLIELKEVLNLPVVGVSLLTNKNLNFESWVNNHFKKVGKRFENLVNPTVTYTSQDLIIIYGYLGDRKIAN